MPPLTPREHEVLRLIAEGQSTKRIALTLGIAFKTAAAHRANLLSKTGAPNVASLIFHASRSGLIAMSSAADSLNDGHPLGDRVWALLADSQEARSLLATRVAESAELCKQQRVRLEQFHQASVETAKRMRDLLRSIEWKRPLDGPRASSNRRARLSLAAARSAQNAGPSAQPGEGPAAISASASAGGAAKIEKQAVMGAFQPLPFFETISMRCLPSPNSHRPPLDRAVRSSRSWSAPLSCWWFR